MPYTVYTLFDAQGTLLYAGRAEMWMRRFEDHAYTAPWFKDVVTANLQHCDTKAEGDALEWRVITEGKPLHNRAQLNPCTGCGGPRNSWRSQLCLQCKATLGRPRARRGQTTTCPKCGGIKDPGPGYCKPCKRQWNKDYRKSKKQNPGP